MSEKIVILYSGGADSRLLLELAKKLKKKINCLLIDYGQLHIEELEFAERQLAKETYEHLTWNVIKINLKINSGLTGNGIKNNSGKVHEMYVPGRNSIFLSYAFSKAESINANSIWIGCDWSDRINLFPDCYQEYIFRMNEAFKYAGINPIRVEAPIIGLSKDMIMELLKSLNIEEKELFSGYGDFT